MAFFADSTALHIHMDRDVISNSSSSRMKLMACSKVIGLTGEGMTLSYFFPVKGSRKNKFTELALRFRLCLVDFKEQKAQ